MKNIRRIFNLVSLFVVSMLFFSCHFFASFTETEDDKVNSVEFDKNSLEISVGAMDIINVTISSTKGQNNEHRRCCGNTQTTSGSILGED